MNIIFLMFTVLQSKCSRLCSSYQQQSLCLFFLRTNIHASLNFPQSSGFRIICGFSNFTDPGSLRLHSAWAQLQFTDYWQEVYILEFSLEGRGKIRATLFPLQVLWWKKVHCRQWLLSTLCKNHCQAPKKSPPVQRCWQYNKHPTPGFL